MSTPTTTETKNGALFAALAKAATEAGSVGKDAKNQHHGYKYASAEGIYAEAREVLHRNGLSLVPVAASLVTVGEAEQRDHRVELVYVLAHASGESMQLHRTWPVVPDRGRPLDKALAAALTTALSYLCRDLLLLPRVDDEVDRREDRTDTRPPPKRAPKGPLPKAAQNPDSDAPPGAEAAEIRTQIDHVLPKVPAEKRAAVDKALAAAGEDVVRLKAGLQFVRGLVSEPKAST